MSPTDRLQFLKACSTIFINQIQISSSCECTLINRNSQNKAWVCLVLIWGEKLYFKTDLSRVSVLIIRVKFGLCCLFFPANCLFLYLRKCLYLSSLSFHKDKKKSSSLYFPNITGHHFQYLPEYYYLPSTYSLLIRWQIYSPWLVRLVIIPSKP